MACARTPQRSSACQTSHVRREKNLGVGGEAGVVEIFEDAANIVIHTFDTGEIVVHETVVFPFRQRIAGKILFLKRFVTREIVGVPDFFSVPA